MREQIRRQKAKLYQLPDIPASVFEYYRQHVKIGVNYSLAQEVADEPTPRILCHS